MHTHIIDELVHRAKNTATVIDVAGVFPAILPHLSPQSKARITAVTRREIEAGTNEHDAHTHIDPIWTLVRDAQDTATLYDVARIWGQRLQGLPHAGKKRMQGVIFGNDEPREDSEFYDAWLAIIVV